MTMWFNSNLFSSGTTWLQREIMLLDKKKFKLTSTSTTTTPSTT
jgi:hypothetical protein